MASNPSGPYILEIPLITADFQHELTVNCDVIGTPSPGASPLDVTLRTRSGTGGVLSGAANAFWDAVRPMFGTNTLAATYTLWKVGVTNTEREFVSAGTLTNANGLSGTAEPAQQATFTFRSGNGGIAKVVLIEPNAIGNTRIPLASALNAAVAAVRTWVLSDDSFLMARDRSFPVAPMNYSLGQNEKIFKRRFRS